MVEYGQQAEQYQQYSTTYIKHNQDYAVITNSKEMVLKLVQNGAKTDLTNDSGRNAFAEAEEFDKLEIAVLVC